MSKVYCIATASICAQTLVQTVSGHRNFTCRNAVLLMTKLYIGSELYKKSALRYTNPYGATQCPSMIYAGATDCGIINYSVDYR